MQFTNKQIKLWGVACSYPLEYALQGCPFNEIRSLRPKDRLNCILNLDEHKVNSLIKHCDACVFYREMKRYDLIPETEENYFLLENQKKKAI
jgi:hypothetical protein